MSYSFTTSDGTIQFNIPDGTTDTSTGLVLPGPNTTGYGLILNQNLVKLLDNFASNTSPITTNLEGQLWFNKFTQTLNVYTTQGYRSVSGVTNTGTQPATARDGDIWFDTTREQTFLYDNGTFKIVGPLYTRSQGVTGAIPVTVADNFNVGISHKVIQLQIGGTVVATVSQDASFYPDPTITGFDTINPGITFKSGINATINSSLVGAVTGDVTGNLTGNVTATTLTGTLTGNVIGNLTGNVTATTLTGTLTGDLNSTAGLITNFSTGNALITGGTLSGLATVAGTTATFTNLNGTVGLVTNFSTANALITGGTVNNLATFSAAAGTVTNLTSSSVDITGGSATGLAHLTSVNLTGTNFSSPNVLISGGSIAGISTLTAGTGTINNFNSLSAIITGGSIDGTPIGASASSTGAFSTLTATTATLTTLALQTLTGPVDANIGTLSLSAASSTSATVALQANLGAYQIATNANLGALHLGNISTQANLGLFQNRTSANVGTLTTTVNTLNANVGTLTNAVIPIGGIILWSGTALTIPTNWHLCDGTNGTPDLRGRFIMGASATLGNVGARGGSPDAVVVSHTHTITDPGHAHSLPGVFYQSSPNGFAGSGGAGQTTSTTGTAATGISIGSTGVSSAGANLPPYYALCYIMRTA